MAALNQYLLEILCEPQNGSKVVMRRTAKGAAKTAKGAQKTVQGAAKTLQGQANKTLKGAQQKVPNARQTVRFGYLNSHLCKVQIPDHHI